MVEAQRKATPVATGQRGPGDRAGDRPLMENLTPAAIVAELDRYIIGQADAKRAVAVALRNRYRRQLLSEELRKEVQPKNILMIGPTGVGKTEIARRVAKIVDAPFIKVEATKFTEVGYVGRDVESIIRDLVEIAIDMLYGERMEQVKDEATTAAVQRLADLLFEQLVQKKPTKNGRKHAVQAQISPEDAAAIQRQQQAAERRLQRERKKLVDLLNQQALEEETVEIEIEEDTGGDDGAGGWSPDDFQDAFQDFLEGFMP